MVLNEVFFKSLRFLWHRLNFSKILSPLTDRQYLHIYHWVHLGQILNLKQPETFNQKIQWLKIYDRNPLYTSLVDKHEVKNWVAKEIGEKYVVKNYGVWNAFEEIDFNNLPETFVLKCTHDSGGLVICRDRSQFEYETAKRKIQFSLERDYYLEGREWPYKDVTPRIIAEEYLSHPEQEGRSADSPVGMIDYKFYCFHGEPKFLYVSKGLENQKTARMTFLDLNWQPINLKRTDYHEFDKVPNQPEHFEEMIKVASRLSKGIPFVRVDLFEHCGKVLFSEMTFHPVSGAMPFTPQSKDNEIGALLDLSKISKRSII